MKVSVLVTVDIARDLIASPEPKPGSVLEARMARTAVEAVKNAVLHFERNGFNHDMQDTTSISLASCKLGGFTNPTTRIHGLPLRGERWLCWRSLKKLEEEKKPRLLIPHADPDVYEMPLDGLFKTDAEAAQYLRDYLDTGDVGEAFVLCRMVLQPIKVFNCQKDEADPDSFRIVRHTNKEQS